MTTSGKNRLKDLALLVFAAVIGLLIASAVKQTNHANAHVPAKPGAVAPTAPTR